MNRRVIHLQANGPPQPGPLFTRVHYGGDGDDGSPLLQHYVSIWLDRGQELVIRRLGDGNVEISTREFV